MLEKFTLMFKNLPLGILTYDIEKDFFSFDLFDNITDTKYLPPILYDYTNLRIDDVPTSDDILDWVKDRVMPFDRHARDHIVDRIGLAVYDEWEICKLSKGMSMEDYWWLALDGDIYEKCHVRYLLENGIKKSFGSPI